MKKTYRTYTRPDIDKLKARGYGYEVEIDGMTWFIPVDEELANINGMRFTIINGNYPRKALEEVERRLRRDRDVVGAVLLGETEKCPECGFTEEQVGFYLDGGEDPYILICNGCNHTWRSENWHDPKEYGAK